MTDLTEIDSNWQIIGETCGQKIGNNQSRQKYETQVKLIKSEFYLTKLEKFQITTPLELRIGYLELNGTWILY